MTFECTLNTSGVSPEKSAYAFIQSYRDTSDVKYYTKHEKRIENFFKKKLEQSISQSRIPQSLSKSFFINFKNDGIYFSSNSKRALRYEFGANDVSPKRFIEPAFIATANEVSQIMITDAIGLYNQYSRFV